MLWIPCYIATVTFILYITAYVTWRLWTRRLVFLTFAPNVPWLGTIPYLDFNPHQLFKKILSFSTSYNHLYVSWIGPIPEVVMGCVDYLEPVMRSQEHITKHGSYNVIQEWLGTGLLTSTGKKWKKRRSALTPAFHFSILNDYMGIFEIHAKNLVNHFQSHADTSEAVDVQEMVNLATLDVICETSMGVKMNALDSSDSDYVQDVAAVKTLLLQRMLNPLLHSNSVYRHTSSGKEFYGHLNKLHNFTIGVINKRIVSRNEMANDKGSADKKGLSEMSHKRIFLDILLDLYEKGEIDIDGIREEVDTLVFEGHDTTSSALCWILYEIGRNPEIQEEVYNEIKSTSIKDYSLLDKVRSLKHTECVIKEGLRLHPPVPGYGCTLRNDLVVGKDVIPAGTNVFLGALDVHLNKAYWDNPTIFNPSRFKSEDFLKRNPYSYIPFSAGPRNCIGQKFAMLELKVFIYYLLNSFNIKSIQSADELEPSFNIVMTSQNGINIEFYTR